MADVLLSVVVARLTGGHGGDWRTRGGDRVRLRGGVHRQAATPVTDGHPYERAAHDYRDAADDDHELHPDRQKFPHQPRHSCAAGHDHHHDGDHDGGQAATTTTRLDVSELRVAVHGHGYCSMLGLAACWRAFALAVQVAVDSADGACRARCGSRAADDGLRPCTPGTGPAFGGA
jgi:hypothetical protein